MGEPLRDGRALWEMLMLEGFQAGLNWITILKKRDNFRSAFDGFDPHIIASWGEADVTRLLGDAGIPAKTNLSASVSRDMKKTDFCFCGPTTVYAWMQVVGMVNDHPVTCPHHKACAAMV